MKREWFINDLSVFLVDQAQTFFRELSGTLPSKGLCDLCAAGAVISRFPRFALR